MRCIDLLPPHSGSVHSAFKVVCAFIVSNIIISTAIACADSNCLAPQKTNLEYHQRILRAIRKQPGQYSPRDRELINVLSLDGRLLNSDLKPLRDHEKPLQVMRGAAHQFGIFHPTANVILLMPAQNGWDVVLQVPSALTGSMNSPLKLTGGHLGKHQDPIEGLISECREEVGIVLEKNRLLPLTDPVKGALNLSKKWRYRSQNLDLLFCQYDPSGNEVIIYDSKKNSVRSPDEFDKEEWSHIQTILDYIQKTDLPSPGLPAPRGLELKSYSREYAFIYAYLLKREELKWMEAWVARDIQRVHEGQEIENGSGEVQALVTMPLSEYVETRFENPQSITVTLLRNVSDLATVVREIIGNVATITRSA